MSYRYKYALKTAGFSLIEMLIGLLVTTIILNTLGFIVIGANQQLRILKAAHSLQQTMRWVVQPLRADIRLAGNMNCGKASQIFPLKTFQRVAYFQGPLVKKNSDAITIYLAGSKFDTLTQDMDNSTRMEITQYLHVKKNNKLLISDCQHSEIFHVQSVQHKKFSESISSLHPLRNKYPALSEISFWEKKTYFIGKTNRADALGNSIYALYLSKNDDPAQEIAENVNDMKITISIATPNQIQEKPLSMITQTDKVIGIAIQLTLTNSKTQDKKRIYTYVAIKS